MYYNKTYRGECLMNYEKRAKMILAESIKELVQIKYISDISVKDIVSNCDMSRASFYRYFHDKYDLMNWVFQTELNEILEEFPDLSNWKEVTYATILFIYDNKNYFKNIARYKNQNSIVEHISERTRFYFLSRFKAKYQTEKLPLKLIKAVDFYCAGMSFLLNEWISKDMSESPEMVIEWMCEFAPPVLLDAIDSGISD